MKKLFKWKNFRNLADFGCSKIFIECVQRPDRFEIVISCQIFFVFDILPFWVRLWGCGELKPISNFKTHSTTEILWKIMLKIVFEIFGQVDVSALSCRKGPEVYPTYTLRRRIFSLFTQYNMLNFIYRLIIG